MFDSSILRYGKLVMPATVKASACSCRTSPVERKANSLQSAFVGNAVRHTTLSGQNAVKHCTVTIG
ncbi:hypothetical protein [Anaeromassilibacillus sp. Marseille-P3371]|uniref:hypothetical protein n=1 Tax=Anaeromassilibacillus sp. Marseille-P3371 TaxID=1944639 RepID=UPI0011779978|nr:hypothetical protein [Anaeromassilibacillus sp. Marseille-P3371]